MKNIYIQTFVYLIASFILIINISVWGQNGLAEAAEEELLSISLSDLLNIKIVTATKKEQSVADTPAIVNVITAAQIKTRGYRTVIEAIESIPGIDVTRDHFQPSLAVRGINSGARSYSRTVKVMIDSQPIANRNNGDNYLGISLIPIKAVERIEIIKGPNSALYGADAYLGVVNIITKRGQDIGNALVMGRFGSIQSNFSYYGELLHGGSYDDLDYFVSGAFGESDRSGIIPQDIHGATKYADADVESEDDESQPMSAFGKINYGNETFGYAGIDFHFQKVDAYGEFQDWGELTHENRMTYENGYVRGKYKRMVIDSLEGNVSIAFSKGEPTSDEKLNGGSYQGASNDYVTRDASFEGFDIGTEFLYSFDDSSSVTVGVDYSENSFDHQTFSTVDDGIATSNPDYIKENFEVEDDFTNSGYYLQCIFSPTSFFDIDFLEPVSFTAGARYDDHNKHGDETTYRIAGVYKFSETAYTKLLYGTSFKAPTSTQSYTNYLTTGGAIGNPSLESEKATIIDWQISAQFLYYFFVNFDVYTSKTENMIELGDPTDAVEELGLDITNPMFLNLGDINSYGLEVELIFSYANCSGYMNFSYQESEIERLHPNGSGRIFDVDTNLYPTSMLKFGINQKIPSMFLNVFFEGRYIDTRIAAENNAQAADMLTVNYDYENYIDRRYRLDEYSVLDLGISSADFKLMGDLETEIMFKVYNILDENYAYPGFGDFDIPGLGRSYVLSMVQHF